MAEAGRMERRVRYQSRRHYHHVARQSRWERSVAQMRRRGLKNSNASVASGAAGAFSPGITVSSDSSLVSEARRYLGGNPTGRGSLWCARFMNMVLQHTGHRGTGSDMARSFANYGQRISGPQIGAIAVIVGTILVVLQLRVNARNVRSRNAFDLVAKVIDPSFPRRRHLLYEVAEKHADGDWTGFDRSLNDFEVRNFANIYAPPRKRRSVRCRGT